MCGANDVTIAVNGISDGMCTSWVFVFIWGLRVIHFFPCLIFANEGGHRNMGTHSRVMSVLNDTYWNFRFDRCVTWAH